MPVAISAVMVAIASSEANRAHAERCKATMPKFDAKTATVPEMSDYADCVNTLHPNDIGPDATIALKIIFVIALAGMIIGAWSERESGASGIVISGLIWAMLAPALVTIAVGMLYGIVWVLT